MTVLFRMKMTVYHNSGQKNDPFYQIVRSDRNYFSFHLSQLAEMLKDVSNQSQKSSNHSVYSHSIHEQSKYTVLSAKYDIFYKICMTSVN